MIGSLLASHCCPLAITWDVVAELLELLPPTIRLACWGTEVHELCTELGRTVEPSRLDGRTIVVAEERAVDDARRAFSRARSVVIVTDDPKEASIRCGLVGVEASRVHVPVERRGRVTSVRFSYHGFTYLLGIRRVGRFPIPPDYDALYNTLTRELPRARTISELCRRVGFHEVPVRLALIHGWLKWRNRRVPKLKDWVPQGALMREGRSARDLLDGKATLLVTVPIRYLLPIPNRA
ncbi:MAG: hypothetical protein ABGY09_04315 [Euryarchaeota archaeon]